jgi:hypothetical protein
MLVDVHVAGKVPMGVLKEPGSMRFCERVAMARILFLQVLSGLLGREREAKVFVGWK